MLKLSSPLRLATLANLLEVRREIRRRSSRAVRGNSVSLAGFVREAWPVLEPATPYVPGWHIDAICQHLEAITDGRITRLLINIPPGTMKSLLVSVFWPAWEWGPRGMPWLRYLTTAYADDLVRRDARRMRDLIQSDWYRGHWGESVKLVRAAEASFANTAMGAREGAAFRGLTGGRGDRVIIDDPHSTETAESEADRAQAIRIFRESVPTRVNDPARSAIVVIMQALNSTASTFMAALEELIGKQQGHIAALEDEVRALRMENARLKDEVRQLRQENGQAQEENRRLLRLVDGLAARMRDAGIEVAESLTGLAGTSPARKSRTKRS